MKKYILSLFFCLTTFYSFACSCAPAASFCEGITEHSIIVLVKVTTLGESNGTATFEKEEVLQGEAPASFEVNLSSMCPNSRALLEENEEALVNLYEWQDNYSLASCVLGVLPLKNGKLIGLVTESEEDMSYKKFKKQELDCFDETNLLTEDDITIYPNPFVQTLFYTNNYVEIQAVEIYNIKGQLLYEESPIASLAGHIDLPNLPAGVYILRIVANEERLSFKVVKGQ